LAEKLRESTGFWKGYVLRDQSAPPMKVNREDEYFIYIFMVSITQLLTKLDYLRRNSA